MPINKGLMSSNTAEWATPQSFFDELNAEFNFTLDPCASFENAKCKKFYTKEDNGLLKSWAGERVFCNPPYGKEINAWVKKCFDESKAGGNKIYKRAVKIRGGKERRTVPVNGGCIQREKRRGRMLDECKDTITISIKQGHIKITGEWIHDLYVGKRYRKKGYGSFLLRQAILAGGNKLYVNIKNKNAIRLYKKFGFIQFSKDERKNCIDMCLTEWGAKWRGKQC